VDKLNAAMVATLNEPAIREKLALQGLEPTPSSPEEFSVFLRVELAKWAKVVKDTGSQPD
jgi:tripartite-type tricarboxylate transporter receptor subunit TctC